MYARDRDEERVPLLAEHRHREPPNAIHLSDDYRKWHIEWFLLGRTRLPVYDDPTGRLRESGTKWPLFIPLASVADCCVLSAAIIYNGGLESLSDNMWLGPSLSTIVLFGAKDVPLILEGEWWRFITSGFMHLGIIHLLSNLLGQLVIGTALERVLGTWRIIIIYFLSGLGGAVLSGMFLPRKIMAGSSPMVIGLLGVYLVDIIVNWRYFVYPKAQLSYLLGLVLVVLGVGLLPYLDNFAHIGGMLGGMLASMAVLPFGGSRAREVGVNLLGWFLILVLYCSAFFIFYARVDIDHYCEVCEYLSCIPVSNWCDANA